MKNPERFNDAQRLAVLGWEEQNPRLASIGFQLLASSIDTTQSSTPSAQQINAMDYAMETVFVKQAAPWGIENTSHLIMHACPIVDTSASGINAAIKFNTNPSSYPNHDIWQPIYSSNSPAKSPVPGGFYNQTSPQLLPPPFHTRNIVDESTNRLWSYGIDVANTKGELVKLYQWWEMSKDLQLIERLADNTKIARNTHELNQIMEADGFCNASELDARVFPNWLTTFTIGLRERLNLVLPTLSAQGLVPITRQTR